MSAAPDLDGFIEGYIDAEAWKDGRDPDTCRYNAEKYAQSLRGTDNRLGWFGWLREEQGKEASEADTDDVRGFLRFLQECGLSASSRTQARSAISLWYQHMEPSRDNPIEGLDASWSVTTDKEKATGHERTYLSRDEVRALVDNVPEPTLRSELIIKLLYQTGVRLRELAQFESERVDLDERKIRVYGEKASEWRIVTFRDSLRTPLRIWLDGPRQDEPGFSEGNKFLFPSPTTREGTADHLSGNVIRTTVVQAAERAGIQSKYGEDAAGKRQFKITPHVLRHTFAVHSAENNVPAPHLKEVLGHHSLDITQIYLDIAGSDAASVLKERGPSL